eukprot:jgi/Galph1/5475/GphlegSOOS_G4163.1
MQVAALAVLPHAGRGFIQTSSVLIFSLVFYVFPQVLYTSPCLSAEAKSIEKDLGKVGGGAASSGKTSTGVSRTVTRGVNLNGADFSEQNLDGISFQQSLLRSADFHKSSLVSASFFGAELSYANLEDVDLTAANLELADLRHANLRNAVLKGAYVSGNTRFEGADIEGADFSDVILRKDQRKLLCNVAKGKNSHSQVDTRESLGCGP